jgi:hypothetical protein
MARRVPTQVRVAFPVDAKRNLRRSNSFLSRSWWPGHSLRLLLRICAPKERWRLSADAKALTIKSDVDFPDFPPEISAAVSGTTSNTTTYTRTESPESLKHLAPPVDPPKDRCRQERGHTRSLQASRTDGSGTDKKLRLPRRVRVFPCTGTVRSVP